MGDTLVVFGKTWNGVNGIKAYDNNGNLVPYTRGGSSGGNYQAKTNINPSTSSQTITPDSGYDALSSVQINAMPSGTAGTPTATKGAVSNHSITVTPSVTNTTGYITGGTKTGTGVTVSASELVNGTLTILENMTGVDVTNYASVDVDVDISAAIYQNKTGIEPSEVSQTITPDAGFDALASVQINRISEGYVGTGITRRSSSDLTVSGATVTAPAGYYGAVASKSVASGTEGTPTATKGTVSNNSVSVTPSVTNSAGYITGGTKNGTVVSVSASELVSGTYSVTSSGTKDVTNYASASVPAGTVTAPSSISGTSATVSTGTNTLTLTKTVSVTPSVSTAGFVSSGTAGNSDVSLTASVTTQAAQTIHPSTTDQSIAASRYLTGAQTIKAVTMSNLTAANIKKDVVVKIGDSTDDDCVTSITGTYEGGGSSKNVQVAQSTTRIASTSYTKTASLTCAVTGKYDVYWDCFRSSTSGTNGSQLYIGGQAYGSANTTFSSSIHVQNNHLTNVNLTANQEVAVYVRSRATNYYAYCGQLTIVQTA